MFWARPSRKRWSELSRTQKGALLLLSILQFALLAAALWDLRHRPDEAIRGSKRLWTLFAFVNFVGPIAYFWKGRKPMEADRTVATA